MNKQVTWHFTKMHGLGNDIVIVDCLREACSFDRDFIRALADRHTGIGFDQFITVEASRSPHTDFFCRIFNPNGSEAEQCGNGLRCVARYVHEQKIHPHDTLTIQTMAGHFPIVMPDYSAISVTMNSPTMIDDKLTLSLPTINDVELVSLLLGNPHAIMRVDHVLNFPVETIGPLLSAHAHFPHGANIGFMQVDNPHQVTLRTYERGAGLTLACGSNATAAAVAGIAKGWLTSPVTIHFQRGYLTISWDGAEKLVMQGPASVCYRGEFDIRDFIPT